MPVPLGFRRRHSPPSALSARTRPIWIAGCTALAAFSAAVIATAAGGRVDIQTRDGRGITGTIVREAQDGSLLLEHDDGRYELLDPAAIASRSTPAPPIPSETPAEYGKRVLAELPAGFDLLVTKHYVVCFDTSREYAKWSAALFERLHDAFGNYWSRAGLEVVDPKRPLVVVIFANRQDYEAHAADDLGAAADRVVGYYNLLSNRVTTFDLTGSDVLAPKRGRRPGQVGLEILSNPAATGLISTLVHEATHQLAFNDGMHQRLAPVPLWVSEGIATYFETPDLTTTRAWRAVGSVNQPRLDHFLKTYRPGCLEGIIRAADSFRNPDTALDSYAAAWALCHHLLQMRKGEFVEYLQVLAAKQPLVADSPTERLEEFQAAFGDPGAVEQAVMKTAARLASRPR